MTDSPRYAVYIVPAADTPLWAFGSRVLGYDASSGSDIEGFHLPGIGPAVWRQLAARARTYGFHATLKAPIRLKPAYTELDLCASLALLAQGIAGFSLGPLAPTVISQGNGNGFVALTMREGSAALAGLERRVVEELDDYRAGLTEEEIARRQPERLSERQRAHLQRFGYPHVLEDYRFHMTLTDAVAGPETLAGLLADAICNAIGTANLVVSDLVLLRQDKAQARFRILQRFALQGLRP